MADTHEVTEDDKRYVVTGSAAVSPFFGEQCWLVLEPSPESPDDGCEPFSGSYHWSTCADSATILSLEWAVVVAMQLGGRVEEAQLSD